ncbi:MAG: hypothetical protein SFZ24_09630 [Planctomycetota bacterium]|nr:hypothetical protein [Planctomycetota bacterium]
MSSARRSETLVAAALAGPPIVVLLLRASLTIGPSPATAALPAPAAPPALQAATEPALTPEQKAALGWIAEQSADVVTRSPMNHPPAIAAEQPAEQAPAEPAARPAPAGQPPRFVATTIMAGPRGGVAVINGRVYRVGESPAPGWRVESIDAGSSTVELTGPDGQTATCTPQPRRSPLTRPASPAPR